MSKSELYFGVMSGTSMDGIDTVLVKFTKNKLELLDFNQQAYSNSFRKKLLSLCDPKKNDLEESYEFGIIHAELTAKSIKKMLKRNHLNYQSIKAIGYHGQTIRHRPEKRFSIQIGNAHLLADKTKINVINDFRNRDMVDGGEGAPLVPAFHQAFFKSSKKNRLIVNIGGISNLTYIQQKKLVGFDCGPGNLLMDYWAQQKIKKNYDKNGSWAQGGDVNHQLLKKLLSDKFFKKNPPKSTGREYFNSHWLLKNLNKKIDPQSVQRTLLELTVQTIFQSAQTHCKQIDEIYVCGGGSQNKFLMLRLTEQFNKPVQNTENIGIPSQEVESVAFAWLAKTCLEKQFNNSPKITGSRGLKVLGVIHHG